MHGRQLHGLPAALALAAVVVLVIGWLAYATWGSRSDEWGPMAVATEGNGDMARNEGVLRISDACVVLERLGESALLVWWRDQVTWDAEARRILFTRRDDTVIELREGQEAVVGGSGGLPSQVRNRLDWVADPDPGCPVDTYWHVGDVEPPGGN